MTQLVIERELLEKWQKALDEPKLPKNACFNVAEEIYDFIGNATRAKEKPNKRRALAFHEVVAGNDYEVFGVHGQKYAVLNGQRVTCVQKNRTKVVIAIQQDLTHMFTKGYKFTIPTNCLRELANE